MYCKQAIALAINIKNHFDRVVNQQVDRTVVMQVLPPFQMPTHLENLRKVCAGCKVCSLSPNKNESCKDEVFLIECSRCIRNIGFDDFATSLLTGTAANTTGKKRTGSSPFGIRKRTMEDEDDYLVTARAKRCPEPRSDADYSPMDCMHQAVGLQNARRVLRSSKEAALEEISSSFDFDDAGSALLLELKETMNADQGAGDTSRCDFAAGFEPALGCPTVVDLGAAASNCLSTNPDILPAHDSLRITTSPFAYEKRGSPEHQLEMDTPSGPMPDLLFSCYRDGIYPSPVMPFPPSATLRGSTCLTPNGGDSEEKLDCSEIACAGTEVDTSGVEPLTRYQVASHLLYGPLGVSLGTLTSKFAEGEQFQSCSVPRPGSDADCNGNTVGPSPPQRAEQQGQGDGVQPLVLAYDELQQLLTHLLAEAHD